MIVSESIDEPLIFVRKKTTGYIKKLGHKKKAFILMKL